MSSSSSSCAGFAADEVPPVGAGASDVAAESTAVAEIGAVPSAAAVPAPAAVSSAAAVPSAAGAMPLPFLRVVAATSSASRATASGSSSGRRILAMSRAPGAAMKLAAIRYSSGAPSRE